MPIQLFDSLERKLKPLAPSQPDGVFRQAMPQRSVKSAGADRAAAVSFSLRTLDLSKISAAAYGDWDDARN